MVVLYESRVALHSKWRWISCWLSFTVAHAVPPFRTTVKKCLLVCCKLRDGSLRQLQGNSSFKRIFMQEILPFFKCFPISSFNKFKAPEQHFDSQRHLTEAALFPQLYKLLLMQTKHFFTLKASHWWTTRGLLSWNTALFDKLPSHKLQIKLQFLKSPRMLIHGLQV